MTGLKIPLLVRDEVAIELPVEIELQESDLVQQLSSLAEFRESAYEDLAEYSADLVEQTVCMDCDSDDDISPKDDVQGLDESVQEGINLVKVKFSSSSDWSQKIFNYSRRRSKEWHANNYAEKEDISSVRLAKDAKLIQEAIRGDKSFTTILCVALRDKHGHIKKFAFCNSEFMPPSCRDKAESLGYAIIKAEQSHAEGQFLQFLYKRAIINSGLYTHIVAMGCSKLHCPECDLVLQLVLGSNYKAISAAIGTVTENITQLEIQEEHDPADANFTITRNASIHCTIQSGDQAARTDLSEKFYMPDGLKALIEQQIEPRRRLQVIGNSRYSKSKKRR